MRTWKKKFILWSKKKNWKTHASKWRDRGGEFKLAKKWGFKISPSNLKRELRAQNILHGSLPTFSFFFISFFLIFFFQFPILYRGRNKHKNRRKTKKLSFLMFFFSCEPIKWPGLPRNCTSVMIYLGRETDGNNEGCLGVPLNFQNWWSDIPNHQRCVNNARAGRVLLCAEREESLTLVCQNYNYYKIEQHQTRFLQNIWRNWIEVTHFPFEQEFKSC